MHKYPSAVPAMLQPSPAMAADITANDGNFFDAGVITTFQQFSN